MGLLERERELAAIDALLEGGRTMLVLEGAAGIGKTALVDAACLRAEERGFEIMRARGSELEADFAFGVVLQLFERRLAHAAANEREALLAGPAAAVRRVLLGDPAEAAADRSFAVLHGLYWLAVNLAARRPLLLAVDDAQWVDEPSLRWLAYLAPRLDGPAPALLVALRLGEPAATSPSLAALREDASAVVRPALLSEGAVGAIVRAAVGDGASDELCAAVWTASGGNPLYVSEVVRAVGPGERPAAELDPAQLLAGGREGIARRVVARVRGLDPRALGLVQALAVLGDGCELRHAAAIAGVEMEEATRLAAGLVRLEVLAGDDPPRFVHPIVREGLEASLRRRARRASSLRGRSLARRRGSTGAGGRASCRSGPGRRRLGVEALAGGRAGSDGERCAANGGRLSSSVRCASRLRLRSGWTSCVRRLARRQAPGARRPARAWRRRCGWRTSRASAPRSRSRWRRRTRRCSGGWTRWTSSSGRWRSSARLTTVLAARLEGELVVCGLHDARRAARVAPVLERLSSRSPTGTAAEALAVARGMAMVLAGRPAAEAAVPLEDALSRAETHAENWDTRAALLWSLIAAERFETVEAALEPIVAEVHRSGSARGLVAAYSTLGLLELRLGALPEADAAARVALRCCRRVTLRRGLRSRRPSWPMSRSRPVSSMRPRR